MKAPIFRLHGEVEALAKFLKFSINIEKARTSPLFVESLIADDIARYVASASWRRHSYASTIIALYGAHERFIRDFVSEVADLLSKIYESYDRLPERIRGRHEQLTVDRAKEILSSRAETQQDFRLLIGNLHACLAGSMAMNRDVFSSSTSNYRHEVVRGVFSRLGLDISQFPEDRELFQIVRTMLNGLYASVPGVIDDLADRRNEIAHGSDFEILDLGTMRAIVAAVYRYDCWLYTKCARHLLNKAVIERAEPVAEIAKSFRHAETGVRSVGSVTSISAAIRPNDQVYLLKNGEVEQAVVRTIQKDRVDIEEATPGIGPYGIDFGCPVRANTQLRRLPAHLSALTTMLELAMQEKPEMLMLEDD